MIYLSYAHADQKWANDLKTRLGKDGYDVVDMPVLLATADILVVVATPTAASSEGVLADIESFPSHEKRVISVIPPDAPPATIDWMPHHLALMPYLDFGEADQYPELKKRLGAPQKSRRERLAEEAPQSAKRRRFPFGLLLIVVLVAGLIAALVLPAGNIPAIFGVVLVVLLAVGLIRLAWNGVQRERVAAYSPVPIPDAFIEVIQSAQTRHIGRRWPLRTTITDIGRQPDATLRFRGIEAHQCSILYDLHDDMFYLETENLTAITTLHDRILQPERPLAMWNGDLLMLSDTLVLQFRFGQPTQSESG